MLKLIQKKLLDKIVSRVFMKLLFPSPSPRGDGLPLEETHISSGGTPAACGALQAGCAEPSLAFSVTR